MSGTSTRPLRSLGPLRALLVSGPVLVALALLLSGAASAMTAPAVFALLLVALLPWPLLRWAASDRAGSTVPPRNAASVSSSTELAPSPAPWADDPRLRFVASMGHDLRSPLNSMLGFADLLQMTAGPQDAGQADSVEIIRQRTRDLLVVIDDMLLWARLESGGLRMRPEAVGVRELMDQAAAVARERSGGRGLSVRCDYPNGRPQAHADAERVVQALVALMHDAIRSPNPVEVDLSARQVGDAIVVDVHDPALLIRSADRADFFEAFRPSFAPSGQRVAGLGVGVACARAFIRAHGGELSLQTAEGEGTTFTMQLPVSPC